MKATQRLRLQLAGDLRSVLVCLITWATLQGGDFDPLYVGGYDTSGNAMAVALSGHYAYVADGTNGLQVIDISDLANPRRTGWYSGNAWAVAVSGHYAYLGGEASLQVIDISDSANPQPVGSCDTFGYVSSVAVSDDHAYVMCFGYSEPYSGLQVIDISDPAKPRGVGNLATSDGWGVAVSGDYAYVADGWAGLQVIDISDPANPQRTCGSSGGLAYGVAVSANFAYVTGRDSRLQVIDVSAPTNPRVSGQTTGGYGDVFSVAVSGSYAYLAPGSGVWDRSGVLRVIDVSVPTNPREVGRSTGSYGDVFGVAVAGQCVFLACDSRGLMILRAAFQPESRLIHRQPSGRATLRGDAAIFTVAADPGLSASYQWEKDGVLLADDRRISGATGARLEIRDVEISDAGDYTVTVSAASNSETSHPATLEVSQPRKVSLIGSVDIAPPGWWSGLVAVSGNHAYCTCLDSGNNILLQVIDVSNPALPRRVGTCRLTGKVDWWAQGLIVSGAQAYVATDGGLEVVEVTDPTAPRTVGWFPMTGQLRDVAVSGEHAFLADGATDGGLVVVRIVDPTDLQAVAEYPTGGPAYQVAVSGQYAFVTTFTPEPVAGGRLLVLDISDPASPRFVGKCPTSHYPWHSWGKIAVGNQHLYVGGGALSVINIADPVNPQQVGEYPGLFGIEEPTLLLLGIWDDRGYVVRGLGLFEVLDLSDPAHPQAVGKWDTTQVESRFWSGTVTSNLIYVLVDNRLEIFSNGPLVQIPPTSIQALAGGEFSFRVSSEPGQPVEVQATDDFGAWTTINTITNTAGHTDLTDPVDGRDRRFYRLRLKE